MAHYVRFPSTFWTTIAQRPERARIRMFASYRTPIFNFIRNHGFTEHDAEDLTQEVFVRLCEQDFLAKVDKAKGKLRNLLLAVTRHVILKHRERAGRRRAASIEQGRDGEPALEVPEASEPDPQFDELWVRNLTRLALERLMGETSPGGPRYYDALVLCKLQGLSYQAAAEKLRVSVSDINNWVHQAKNRFKAHLREALQGYCSSEQEYREELGLLARLMN